jgi:hypothetical protein
MPAMARPRPVKRTRRPGRSADLPPGDQPDTDGAAADQHAEQRERARHQRAPAVRQPARPKQSTRMDTRIAAMPAISEPIARPEVIGAT